MAWDILEHNLENEAGHRIEVAGKCLAAKPQCFQWNRTSSCEWVHDQGGFIPDLPVGRQMGGLDQGAGRRKVAYVRRIVPVGEVSDEAEERFAQALVGYHLFVHVWRI